MINTYIRDATLVNKIPASEFKNNLPITGPPIYEGRKLSDDDGDEDMDDTNDERVNINNDNLRTEKRQVAGSCSTVTIDELRQRECVFFFAFSIHIHFHTSPSSVPHFNKIEEYADREFGTGKRNVIVNLQEVCILRSSPTYLYKNTSNYNTSSFPIATQMHV